MSNTYSVIMCKLWAFEPDKTKLPIEVKEKYYNRYFLFDKFNKAFLLAILYIAIVFLLIFLIPPQTKSQAELVNTLNNIANSWEILFLYLIYIPFLIQGYYRLPRYINVGIGMALFTKCLLFINSQICL